MRATPTNPMSEPTGYEWLWMLFWGLQRDKVHIVRAFGMHVHIVSSLQSLEDDCMIKQTSLVGIFLVVTLRFLVGLSLLHILICPHHSMCSILKHTCTRPGRLAPYTCTHIIITSQRRLGMRMVFKRQFMLSQQTVLH